jgi:3-hydroxyacyl-[acyl-carrier-protein] dehydratase
MTDAGKILDSVGPQELLKLLPHRYPFLLVDRVTAIDGDNSCIGIKNVTFTEPFFQGHFRRRPESFARCRSGWTGRRGRSGS